MLKPKQIPDEVVEAALKKRGLMREAIADALNAWPGMHLGHQCVGCGGDPQIILPLPQEKTNG